MVLVLALVLGYDEDEFVLTSNRQYLAIEFFLVQ